MRDVTSQWHAAQVDNRELYDLLLRELHQASFTSSTRIDMPDGGRPSVSLHYHKSGNIRAIETDFPEGKVAELAATIETNLLTTTGVKWGREVLFVAQPVVGAWEGADFNIIEAPPNAPRPPYMHGDYPCILEFPFSASPDPFTNIARMHRVAARHSLTISAFLPLLALGNRYSTHHWGVPARVNDDQTRLVPVWVQDFYAIDGLETISLTPIDLSELPPIPIVSDEGYFTRGIHLGEAFPLPASFAAYIDRVARLPSSRRVRFDRAAYWLRFAAHARRQSGSAALIAYVQAIESLIPPRTGAPRCSTCGLQVGKGPTTAFQEFLAEYAPAHDEDRQLRKRLYQQRSQFTHGHDMFLTDIELRFGMGGAIHMAEDLLLRHASESARLALVIRGEVERGIVSHGTSDRHAPTGRRPERLVQAETSQRTSRKKSSGSSETAAAEQGRKSTLPTARDPVTRARQRTSDADAPVSGIVGAALRHEGTRRSR